MREIPEIIMFLEQCLGRLKCLDAGLGPDYIANFSAANWLRLNDELQPGLKLHANQNGAENTNRENKCIVSLTVWPFRGAQFSTFWDNYSLKDDGTEAKPVFGCISLS